MAALLVLLAAQPAIAEPSRHAALAAALRDAREGLCPRCVDDIEASGINRPMLRMMRGEAALDRAGARLDEAALTPGMRRMLRARLDAAMVAVREFDEAEAAHAIRRAERLLRTIP